MINMFKLKIKNWCPEFDDFDVNVAKSNYKKYQDKLECKRRDYIKTLCDEIKIASRNGCQSIETENLLNDMMTYEFMMELKEYFEQKGFNVKEVSNGYGVITSWLRISWED